MCRIYNTRQRCGGFFIYSEIVCRVPLKHMANPLLCARLKPHVRGALCRHLYAMSYTRQRVCRVFIGFCRVQQAHGKPPVSRSVAPLMLYAAIKCVFVITIQDILFLFIEHFSLCGNFFGKKIQFPLLNYYKSQIFNLRP